ncbi:unnamed protein product, partial [Protopolystoma xenopodis]
MLIIAFLSNFTPVCLFPRSPGPIVSSQVCSGHSHYPLPPAGSKRKRDFSRFSFFASPDDINSFSLNNPCPQPSGGHYAQVESSHTARTYPVHINGGLSNLPDSGRSGPYSVFSIPLNLQSGTPIFPSNFNFTSDSPAPLPFILENGFGHSPTLGSTRFPTGKPSIARALIDQEATSRGQHQPSEPFRSAGCHRNRLQLAACTEHCTVVATNVACRETIDSASGDSRNGSSTYSSDTAGSKDTSPSPDARLS